MQQPSLNQLPLDLQLIVKKLQVCPYGCDPTSIQSIIPEKYQSINSFARCIRCLTSWEVNGKAEIVELKAGVDVKRDEQGNPIKPKRTILL